MKLLIALMMMSVQTIAQSTTYTVTTDKKNGSLIYNGLITFDDLNNEPSFTWLKNGREDYSPRESKIEQLKDRLNEDQYSMVVFLGTWCSDSHYLIPKLEKVLDLIHFPNARLTMYGVDREKTTVNGEDRKYKISNVPTIIVMKNGHEVGRITESVDKSIEADLADIVR
jgi:thiol-disulfide isomerase/thioredoxin